MAIKRYDGTTDGSNSGWKARFKSEVGGADGHAYRVEIIDSGTTAGTFSQTESTVNHIELVGDDAGAFLLEYDGNTDQRHTPLVPSTFTIQVLEETAQHGQLFDAIQNNLDNRFGLALFVFEPDENAGSSTPTQTDQLANADGYWRPMWFGTIMADQGESKSKDSPLRVMTLTAQCGLVLLNDEPFRPAGEDIYDDSASMARTLGRCFEKLPTSSLWGWNEYNGATTPSHDYVAADIIRSAATDKPVVPFLRESVWILDKSQHLPTTGGGDPIPGGASVLENTFVPSKAFIDVQTETDPLGGKFRKRSFTSCGEVMEHCASLFGAQIFLSWGSWWFTNPDVHVAEFDTNVDHRQHAWMRQIRLVNNIPVGPITDPLDTRSLEIWQRGFDLTDGVVETVMFPVQSVSSIHLEGGSRSLISSTGNSPQHTDFGFVNLDLFTVEKDASNQISFIDKTFSNAACVIGGGQTLTLSGTIILEQMGRLLSAYVTTRCRGMKYRCNLTIKVGDYYLKRDITTRSETAPIKNSIGVQVATAKFFDQSGDVEWTTNADTYDFVLPRTTSDPPAATVILSSGDDTTDFEFVGGLHAQRRDNNDAEFKTTEGLIVGDGTMQHDSYFDMAWTLPALPENIEHTGVTITFSWSLLDSDNELIVGSELFDIMSNVRTFDANDQTDFGGVHLFKVVVGAGEDDEDVEFIARQDNNVSKIVTCESVLGDKYDETQQFRSVRVRHHSTGVQRFPERDWVTCDTVTNDGKYIHELRAFEVLQKRDKPLLMKDVNISFTDRSNMNLSLSNQKNSFTASAFTVLHFGRPVLLEYDDGTQEFYQIIELKWTNATVGATLCKLSTLRPLTSVTEANDFRRPRGPRPIGTIQPVSTGPTSKGPKPIGPAVDLKFALNDDAVTAIQSKTDFITIGSTGITGFTVQPGSNVIRADEVLTNPSRLFATNAQLQQIATNQLTATANTSSVLTNAGNISSNATGISQNATNITSATSIANAANNRSVANQTNISTNATGISGNSGLISTNQTSIVTLVGVASANQSAISSNTTNIANNASGIATNTAAIATNANDITALELQADTDANGASQRTGQTGVEVATFSASGVLGSVVDGNAGQFLKTNGSGVLSFANAGGGWHGSTTLMKVFPTEFMGNDVGRAIVATYIEDDNSGEFALRINQSAGKVFAINEIPTGFKATHVQVYTDTAVTNGVEVFTFNQTTGAVSSVGTGNTNASIDITDITSSATAAMIIQVTPGSLTVDIFGADITIATV